MTQYGSGSSFQQQCPPFPAPPPGYDVWNEDLDGAVPADVVAHAKSLANNMALPLGYADTVWSGGVALLVRVDPHPWTTDASGQIVPGCFHGATVYVPTSPTPPAPASASSGSKGIGVLGALSLMLGIGASSIAIVEYLRK